MDFLPVFVVDMRPDWFMMEDGRPTVEDDLPATSDLWLDEGFRSIPLPRASNNAVENTKYSVML